MVVTCTGNVQCRSNVIVVRYQIDMRLIAWYQSSPIYLCCQLADNQGVCPSDGHQGPISDPIRRLIERYRKVSKPRELYLNFHDHPEIWQAPNSTAAEVPVKFQSDAIIWTTFLRDFSRFCEKTSYRILKQDDMKWKQFSVWLSYVVLTEN